MNSIDRLLAKWQKSRDSHASHLLGGQVTSMEEYQRIRGMYYTHEEIIQDLKELKNGVEEDDADD